MMQWYYQSDGSSRGPISGEQLLSLRSTGHIDDDTPVWTEGMMAWERLASVSVRSEPAFGEPIAPVDRASCTLCQKRVALDQMIWFQDQRVCAECKPLFVHRLKEGVRWQQGMVFAGFWPRALARIIDTIILYVLNLAFMVPFMFVTTALSSQGNEFGALFCLAFVLLWMLQLGVTGGYEIWFLRRRGATPGKMALRLKVVRSDGSPLSWGRATGRFFGNMLTGMTMFVGYVIAAFDSEKRALHDMICDTRVIVRRP
jgi:uncharacterized RDD family membrane protein YckC